LLWNLFFYYYTLVSRGINLIYLKQLMLNFHATFSIFDGTCTEGIRNSLPLSRLKSLTNHL
jgi:hypothetical protein